MNTFQSFQPPPPQYYQTLPPHPQQPLSQHLPQQKNEQPISFVKPPINNNISTISHLTPPSTPTSPLMYNFDQWKPYQASQKVFRLLDTNDNDLSGTFDFQIKTSGINIQYSEIDSAFIFNRFDEFKFDFFITGSLRSFNTGSTWSGLYSVVDGRKVGISSMGFTLNFLQLPHSHSIPLKQNKSNCNSFEIDINEEFCFILVTLNAVVDQNLILPIASKISPLLMFHNSHQHHHHHPQQQLLQNTNGPMGLGGVNNSNNYNSNSPRNSFHNFNNFNNFNNYGSSPNNHSFGPPNGFSNPPPPGVNNPNIPIASNPSGSPVGINSNSNSNSPNIVTGSSPIPIGSGSIPMGPLGTQNTGISGSPINNPLPNNFNSFVNNPNINNNKNSVFSTPTNNTPPPLSPNSSGNNSLNMQFTTPTIVTTTTTTTTTTATSNQKDVVMDEIQPKRSSTQEKELLEKYYREHYLANSKNSKEELIKLSASLGWEPSKTSHWLESRRSKDKNTNKAPLSSSPNNIPISPTTSPPPIYPPPSPTFNVTTTIPPPITPLQNIPKEPRRENNPSTKIKNAPIVPSSTLIPNPPPKDQRREPNVITLPNIPRNPHSSPPLVTGSCIPPTPVANKSNNSPNNNPNNNTKKNDDNPEKWSNDQVLKWLESIQLPELISVFKENYITGETLFLINEEDFPSLGLTKVGYKIKFKKELKLLEKKCGSVK